MLFAKKEKLFYISLGWSLFFHVHTLDINVKLECQNSLYQYLRKTVTEVLFYVHSPLLSDYHEYEAMFIIEGVRAGITLVNGKFIWMSITTHFN